MALEFDAGMVFQASLKGTVQGQQTVTSFHFRTKTALGTTAGLAAALATAYTTNLVNSWGTPLRYLTLGIRVYQVPESLDEYTYGSPIVGAAGANIVPTQVAGVVTLLTGNAGRSRRGRIYIPGFANTYVGADGKWTAAYLSAVSGAMNALLAAFGPSGSNADFEWGIWSRKLGETRGGVPEHVTAYNLNAGFQPIIAVNVRDVPGTQRRRRIGVGS